MREHRNNHAHEEVVVVGCAAPHGWPQVTLEGCVGRVGEHGEIWAGGKMRNNGRTCVAEGPWLFGITGDWNTVALDPGAWSSTVRGGGCRFMAAWVKVEEKASEHR